MLPLYQQRNYLNNMADVNKQKLQLRSGLSVNGDKTLSPAATKLLINHGKPNFTIQRTTKAPNGNINCTSPTPATSCNNHHNNNDFIVKSTTFNGIFKPSNISTVTKQTLPQNGNTVTSNATDNEATKVVLRRPKIVSIEKREEKNDDNVPEFIRRQRRIQERLANQNILDFENRRSGYFTQVLLSPSSPNRQSFAETMASPAVKPGLEMPPPATQQHEDIQEETSQKEQEMEQQLQQQQSDNEKSPKTVTLNGQAEEEEVAKAIEEVNRAVEGEDDDKADLEDHNNNVQQQETKQNYESTVLTEIRSDHVEETKSEREENKTSAVLENTNTEEIPIVNSDEIVKEEQSTQENCNNEAAVETTPPYGEQIEEQNLQNGQSLSQESAVKNTITISHTNGLNSPCLPSPDPKGVKGVNFETKTVVSFSQELGNGDNKYPDTVKVVRDVKAPEVDSELKELTKLKFEIKADDQDIEVKPVLINETA